MACPLHPRFKNWRLFRGSLAKLCGFIPFSILCEKLDGIRELGISGSLKPNFLKTTAEFFGDSDVNV
jgi:hypothetical protein